MNVVYCTFFDLTRPSPGLNKIYQLRSAIKKYGINLIIIGSGCTKGKWAIRNKNFFKEILFNRKNFKSIRHSESMRLISEASKFYSLHLKKIILQLKVSGSIIYAPQGEMVGAILKISNETKSFLVADCGEYYRFSFHYFFNGVLFQQFIFKYFLMKKMNGIIAPSPIWFKRAKSLNLNRVLLPGISKNKYNFRTKIAKKKKPIKILFMGRLNDRELPEVIFKALSICKKRGLDFVFHLVGVRSENYKEIYWLKKLKNFNDLKNKFINFGFVPQSKKLRLLKSADLFIMLRPLNSESEHLFPSRLPELLLTANPSIISKVPPLNYFFKDNVGVKFISSSNNPKELSDKIIELAKSPNKRLKIGNLGRKYALKNFSYEEMGKRLFNFLKNIKKKLEA